MSQENEAGTATDNTETVKDETQDLADTIYDDGKAEADGKAAELAAKEAEGKADEDEKSDKTEDEKKADEDAAAKAKEDEASKQAEVTDPKDFKFTLPEGEELSSENKDALIAHATEQKWTQEQSQKNLDMFYGMRSAEIAKAQQAQTEMIEGWTEEISNDPKIGGPKLAENLAKADALISKVGQKAFHKVDFDDGQGNTAKAGDPVKNDKGIHMTEFGMMLKQTGLGSHPDFVRFMVDLGGVVSEDQIVTASAHQSKKSDEDLFYPDQGKT